ncbi:MAG: hypothetical protein AB8B57_10535 [Congregibacter sp.]
MTWFLNAQPSGPHFAYKKISCALSFVMVLTVAASAAAQDSAPKTINSANNWVFEETFDGDPDKPSQDLLPRTFEYVVTHRTHPKEQFTKPYAAYPADHAGDCAGPNPAVSPLPQHEVFTTQTSSSQNPDPSFFVCKNHMMSSMGEVEAYSNSLFWPRQAFDFSDGATLEFDVNINEGHTFRSWWEVLIAPRDQMRFGPAPLQSAVDETYPQDRIVLDFRGNIRQVRVGKDTIAPSGWIVEERHFGQYDYLDWRDLYPEDPALDDRRIRRKMRIRLEGESIVWGIETPDGSFDEFAVDVPGGIPFSRGIVQFKTHAYTPYKLGNQSTYTFHWDNIRFSGPALQPYKAYHANDVVYLQRNGDRPVGDEVTVAINLPDEPGENPVLVGQINAPLNGQPLLSINGGPDIVVGPDDFPIGDCSSGEWRDWGSFSLPLRSGDLRSGENTLRWKVGPRPVCAEGEYWWDGYSVKFLHIQTDASEGAEVDLPNDAAIEIVIDDKDSAKVRRSGGWRQSGRPDPWAGGSLYSSSSSSAFRWIFDVPVRDTYDVYLWWTSGNGRSNKVPVTVAHDGGTSIHHKNQKSDGGSWQFLGSYVLSPGAGHYVEVSAANGRASADAVRVVTSLP